jgi:transposase
MGRDVHQDTMAVAYVAKAHDAEVVFLGTIGPRHGDLDPRIRQMPAKATQLLVVSEAGPCGDWRSRSLMAKGDDGWGVAPALLPKTPGDRVTTDRRAAGPLARLARSGDLPVGDVPHGADDAIRDLTRAREDTRRAVTSATCRLHAFWLRHASRSTGRAPWGPAHLRGRAAVVCPTPAQHIVCPEDVRAIHEHTERRQRLDQARHDQVTSWRLPPVVEALQARPGVQFTAAVTMVAERGDLTRCEPPRERMTGVGRSPAEDSTGERRRQGAMTTAGKTPARRALVEGAWADRDAANVSRPRPRRLEPPPTVIQDLRWKAQLRRCTRYRQRSARGTHATVVTVARARELAGFMWAMAQHVPRTP